MANMTIKHSNAQFQCSCCDKKGRARRSGRRSVKQSEKRAWKNDYRKGAM